MFCSSTRGLPSALAAGQTRDKHRLRHRVSGSGAAGDRRDLVKSFCNRPGRRSRCIDVDDPFFENYWRRLGPGSWVLGRNRFFALGTYRTVFTDKSSVQVLKISVFFLFTIWKLLFKKQQLEGEERGQQPPASIIMASSDCPPATAKLFELDAARRAKRDEVLLSRIENGACSSSALPLDVRALTGEP